MRHKYSPVILQTLGGPTSQDFEFEKKLQEYKEAKERMASIKKVIDNFPRKLEGYKQMLDTIAGTCDFVFEKNQKDLYQFMHNITSAHKALSEKLNLLFTQFSQLKNSTNIWVKELNSVTDKCKLREQCKKNYDHYESKLYELNTDRMKEIKKNNKISESDHERFIRNIGKFQKSAKELIFSSNQAYRAIEQFMNNRNDKIIMAMVGLVEAERGFFNEANHIMNFFVNIRNNALNMKKIPINNNSKYDASLYIKGRTILNMSVEEIFSPNYKILPAPGYQDPGNNNYQNNNNNFNNNINNKEIINPFTAENNNNFDNNKMNNNNNNFGNNYNNYSNNNNGFINQSTRETFASSNPYNTQANPYSGNMNNNNNNYQRNNSFNNNNNFKNPYNDSKMNFPSNSYNPFGGNNNINPYSGNNNNFNNNNNYNNNNNNYNNNNNNNLSTGNNNKGNNNINNNETNNNDNNEDDDPFNF